LHSYDDQDWVAITISAGQVGSTYYLRTTGLGLTADTVLTLYDTDGTTLLAENDDSNGLGSTIVWTPSTAGTYYVRITPYNYANAGNCGAYYTFVIVQYTAYLPMIAQ
jgi:hypothetical protein